MKLIYVKREIGEAVIPSIYKLVLRYLTIFSRIIYILKAAMTFLSSSQEKLKANKISKIFNLLSRFKSGTDLKQSRIPSHSCDVRLKDIDLDCKQIVD